MASTTYLEKLKDPRWKEKRDEIVERDDYRCQYCGLTDSLQVHHFCYEGDPWEVDSSALVTLCKTCHFNSHRKDLTPLERDLLNLFQSSGFSSTPFCKQVLREANNLLLKHKG